MIKRLTPTCSCIKSFLLTVPSQQGIFLGKVKTFNPELLVLNLVFLAKWHSRFDKEKYKQLHLWTGIEKWHTLNLVYNPHKESSQDQRPPLWKPRLPLELARPISKEDMGQNSYEVWS